MPLAVPLARASSVGPRVDQPGGTVSFAPGAVGSALVLNGASGVRLPDGLIDDHSYSIAMWLQPTAVSQFTTAFFGWATPYELDQCRAAWPGLDAADDVVVGHGVVRWLVQLADSGRRVVAPGDGGRSRRLAAVSERRAW